MQDLSLAVAVHVPSGSVGPMGGTSSHAAAAAQADVKVRVQSNPILERHIERLAAQHAQEAPPGARSSELVSEAPKSSPYHFGRPSWHMSPRGHHHPTHPLTHPLAPTSAASRARQTRLGAAWLAWVGFAGATEKVEKV